MTNSIMTFCITYVMMSAGFINTQSNPSEEGKLHVTVEVKNMRSLEGNLVVTLFSSEESFLNKGEQKIIEVNDQKMMIVTFENLSAGTYAVSVIHDEDKDGDLNAGFMGMPTEDYGFSNDAKGMFGPPEFSEAKFQMSDNTTIQISLN